MYVAWVRTREMPVQRVSEGLHPLLQIHTTVTEVPYTNG